MDTLSRSEDVLHFCRAFFCYIGSWEKHWLQDFRVDTATKLCDATAVLSKKEAPATEERRTSPLSMDKIHI